MIGKSEKASINLLVWTLQGTLDLLRPVQEKCEALPELMLLFAGCWTKWQRRSTKKIFFYLQSEWANCLRFLRGGKNKIKDLSATSRKARVLGHCAGGHLGRHSSSKARGPTVPTARPLVLSSSTEWQRQQGLLRPPARASLVPGSGQVCHIFPRNIWVVLAAMVLNASAVTANATLSHF